MLASSLALMLVFWQWRPVRNGLGGQNAVGRAVPAADSRSDGCSSIATFVINHFDLFGLRLIGGRSRPAAGGTAVRDAVPLPHRRHPLYVGWLFASGAPRR